VLNPFKSNQKVYQVLPNDLRGHQKNFWGDQSVNI